MGKVILSLALILVFVMAMASAFNFETGGVKIIEPIESNGAIPVNIQDQTTPPLDLFFIQDIAPPTFLAEATAIDNLTINVTNATNFSIGDYIGIFSGTGDNRFYFGEALDINGNLITLDTPLDNNFTVGAIVLPATRDLNVDGSVTPQIFQISGVGVASGLEIDITRLMINMQTSGLVDLNKFGDLTALDNGIVLRRVDGDTRNIFNAKTNGEIRNLCYDWSVDVSTNPAQGQNGAGFRFTFAGQEKHGVAVRLASGDSLQIIIQDDLSGLEEFRIIAEGHEVTD